MTAVGNAGFHGGIDVGRTHSVPSFSLQGNPIHKSRAIFIDIMNLSLDFMLEL